MRLRRVAARQATPGYESFVSEGTSLAASPRTVKCHKRAERRRVSASTCSARQSPTSSRIAAAASRISRSSRSSRRIERLRLGKDLLAEVRVDRLARNEVDRTAEERGELVLEVEEPEPQAGVRLQDIEQVDVAVELVITTSNRAEHLQGRNSVTLAHLAQALRVDVHRQHGPRLTERRPLAPP